MQPTSNHQLMGYDRAITLFAPDGRLLQVEYAKKTVKQGSCVVGITYKNGALIIGDRRIVDKLIVAESIAKVVKIDKHVIASASGILSDARVLINYAQHKAQEHKITYDTLIDIDLLVKKVADVIQAYTQAGGYRPFGVSILFAGVNEVTKKPQLFVTDPTGVYFEYLAYSIGEAEDKINDYLEKNYKPDLDREKALKLAISALKEGLQKNFDVKRLVGMYVEEDLEAKSFSEKDFKKFG